MHQVIQLDKVEKIVKAWSQDFFEGPRVCVWLHGDPGVGKSRVAKLMNPYMKSLTKWWDGYQGEKIVLIDDLEKDTMKFLGHYMKIWGDPYGKITGEVKGSTIPLSYEVLIVTSNYSI